MDLLGGTRYPLVYIFVGGSLLAEFSCSENRIENSIELERGCRFKEYQVIE